MAEAVRRAGAVPAVKLYNFNYVMNLAFQISNVRKKLSDRIVIRHKEVIFAISFNGNLSNRFSNQSDQNNFCQSSSENYGFYLTNYSA